MCKITALAQPEHVYSCVNLKGNTSKTLENCFKISHSKIITILVDTKTEVETAVKSGSIDGQHLPVTCNSMPVICDHTERSCNPRNLPSFPHATKPVTRPLVRETHAVSFWFFKNNYT